jgi:WD40 repeat protein
MLAELIREPIMFALYRHTAASLNSGSNLAASTCTELIDEYFSKSSPDQWASDQGRDIHKFAIAKVLPEIGYQMEKKGTFDCSHEALLQYIGAALNENPAISANSDEICRYLIRHSGVLKENSSNLRINTENTYFFSHQIFRDYFSANFIYHQAMQGKYDALSERVLPQHMIEHLSERFDESALFSEWEKAPHGAYISSELSNMLSALPAQDAMSGRGLFETAVNNILDIIKYAHGGGFYGTMFNHADLSSYAFNDSPLFKHDGANIASACFNNCMIDKRTFFPQGHYQWVLCVDHAEKYIVSGGRDGQLKIWDPESKFNLYSYKIQDGVIENICCSADHVYYLTSKGALCAFRLDAAIGKREPVGHAQIHDFGISARIILLGVMAGSRLICLTEDALLYSFDLCAHDDPLVISFDHAFEPDDEVTAASAELSDHELVVGTSTGKLCLLEIDTGTSVAIAAEGSSINAISCRKQREILYTCAKKISYRNLNTNLTLDFALDGYPQIVRFSDNQPRFIAAYSDRTIVEWRNIFAAPDYAVCGFHEDKIESLQYFGDQHCISGGRDSSVMITSLAGEPDRRIYAGYSYWLKRLHVDWDKMLLYIPSSDSTIKLFNLNDFSYRDSFEWHSKKVFTINLIGKNTLISGALDHCVAFWAIDNQGHLSVPPKLVSDPCGDCIDDLLVLSDQTVVGIDTSNTIYRWKIGNGNLIKLPHPGYPNIMPQDQQSKGLAANGLSLVADDLYASFHWDGNMALWKADEGVSSLVRMINIGAWIYDLLVLPNGGFAICTRKGDVIFFDGGTFEIIKRMSVCAGVSLYRMALSGSILFVSAANGVVYAIDVNDYTVRENRLHRERIFYLAVNPEGTKFVTFSEDGHIKAGRVAGADLIPENGKTINYVSGVLIKGCQFANMDPLDHAIQFYL